MIGRWLAIAVFASALSGPAAAQVPSSSAQQDTFSHREAVVNGVRLHYVIGGAGSLVLLVHGFPETWYAWRKVMPLVAKRHTVIVPNFRGAGASGRPAGPYDTGTMAEDLHQLVQQLGYREIDLVGHDVGVAVAYPYAAAHRDEVKHLALLDVSPQGTVAFKKLRSKAWSWALQPRAVPSRPRALGNRYGRVSTSRAEGTVNQLVGARMNKRQQMRWSPRGAHRVLQVRAAVLDGRFGHPAVQLAA